MRDFEGRVADIACAVCGKELPITVYPHEDAAGVVDEEARDEGWHRAGAGWECNECRHLSPEERAYLVTLAALEGQV
jgi:hypothetical protein